MQSWYERAPGEWVYFAPDLSAWCCWVEAKRHWSCVVDYYAAGVGRTLYQQHVTGDAAEALRLTGALIYRARMENQAASGGGAAGQRGATGMEWTR
jgi:hypothetical protein